MTVEFIRAWVANDGRLYRQAQIAEIEDSIAESLIVARIAREYTVALEEPDGEGDEE